MDFLKEARLEMFNKYNYNDKRRETKDETI